MADKFDVSRSTIRRDLVTLEKFGRIKRTHGGAISLELVCVEPSFAEKSSKQHAEKEQIAKKASQFIKSGDTIIIDAGTTTEYLCKYIKGIGNLTVITNALTVANSLTGVPNIELMVTGGVLRQRTLALVGPLAEFSFSNIKADICFISANGIDAKEGITTPNLTEAQTKRSMINAAKRVILLSDHTKVGNVSFAKFASVSDVSIFVVDSNIGLEQLAELKKAGIKVVMADCESEG